MGVPEPKFELQRQTTSPELRQAMWNWLHVNLWRYGEGYTNSAEQVRQQLQSMCEEIWVEELNRNVTEVVPFRPDISHSQLYLDLRKGFLSADWWVPYMLLEAFLQRTDFDSDQLAGLQKQLERFSSAYRVVDNCFIEITDQTQLDAVNDALATTAPLERAHLMRAIEFLGVGATPDYRNSIKEAISAVEATCRTVSGKPSATLGDAIKKIEGIHPVLAAAFSKLYGYTSDESGIRHALSNDDRVSHADALFMLVACSAFISYLKVSTTKDAD